MVLKQNGPPGTGTEADLEAAVNAGYVDPNKIPDIYFGQTENFGRPSDAISAIAPGSDSFNVFDQVLARIKQHAPEQYAAILEASPSITNLKTDQIDTTTKLLEDRDRRQAKVDEDILTAMNQRDQRFYRKRDELDGPLDEPTEEQQAFIDGDPAADERKAVVSQTEKYRDAATELIEFMTNGEPPPDFDGLLLSSMNDRIMKTYEDIEKVEVFGDSNQRIYSNNAGLLVWDQDQNKFVGNSSIYDQFGFTEGQLGLERRESTDRLIQSSELERRFIGLDVDRLTELQEQLFVGGFYATNVDLDRIQFGYHDTPTLDAYRALLSRATLYNTSNKDMTIDDILEEGRQNSDRSLDPNDESNRDATLTALADPGSVRITANSVAQRLLGRKATQEEQRLILSMINDRQRETSKIQGSRLGGEYTQTSPEGIADSFFQDPDRENATNREVDNNSMIGTMANFNEIINRRVV